MFTAIKKRWVKLFTIICLFSGLSILITSGIMLMAAPACMQCNPRSRCITTGYGFHECQSNWKDGQLVSCNLSGGECGGGSAE